LGTRGQELKLNVGVGYLHIKNRTIQFINGVEKSLNKTFCSEGSYVAKPYDALENPRKFLNSVSNNKFKGRI
jgi:hypothetical protein